MVRQSDPPSVVFDVTTLSDEWVRETLDAMIAAISPRLRARLDHENSVAFTEIVEPHLQANIIPNLAPMIGHVIRHAVEFHSAKAIQGAVYVAGERLDVTAYDENGRIVQTLKTPVLVALGSGPAGKQNAR